MEEFFGDYKIDSSIGKGAYGQVYRITREEFGYTYEAALKVIELPQEQSEVETMRREGLSRQNVTEYYKSMVKDIVREFELMSKLKGNSYIVSYEDHKIIEKKDEFGWKICIRMELLTPLLVYVEKNGMSYHDVLRLGINICKALELCQKYNIIHRDIKPENIFVSSNGEFKLGDFGIARQLGKVDDNLSQKGTQSYMAPEIFRGGEYDSTVDIYSLGIVLYRFLNGNRMPFMPLAPLPIRFSDKENALTKRLSGEIMPKPSEASEKLAQVILKACAFRSSERYMEPKMLREALEEVMSEEENWVLFESTKEEAFLEKDTSDMKKRQDAELKTVLLVGNSEHKHDWDKKQKKTSIQSMRTPQEDETVQISIIPQGKDKKFKFIVGGLVMFSVLIFIIGVTVFEKIENQRNTSIIEMVTEKPMSSEHPISILKATERPTKKPKATEKPTKKPRATEKSTKKPKATEKPTISTNLKSIPDSTIYSTTEIPKKKEEGNSQEVIDVKPEEQQEIIIK